MLASALCGALGLLPESPTGATHAAAAPNRAAAPTIAAALNLAPILGIIDEGPGTAGISHREVVAMSSTAVSTVPNLWGTLHVAAAGGDIRESRD